MPVVSLCFPADECSPKVGHASECRDEHRTPVLRAPFSLSIVQGRGQVGHEPGKELPPLVTVSDVAEFASLLGNPARASMIMALLDQDYCTARELADVAGVTAQTASGHIAKLLEAGILARVKIGREQRHRIHSREIEAIIRLLYLGGAKLAKREPRPADPGLRAARRCGGHIAGKLGIEIARRFTSVTRDGQRRLREDARNILLKWGLSSSELELEGAECTLCEDWSEQGHHLGGGLGRAIHDRCIALGWMRPDPVGRAMIITSAGVNGFQLRFGIEVS